MKSPKQTQEQAEARFKRKDQQARDATSAMAEYEASQAAVRKKTEKLRALRLAKEAEDAKAKAEAPPAEVKPKKKAPAKAKA